MPRLHTHTLSDGLTIHIQLKRSAKKNLILRPVSADTVSINIPPFVTQHTFTQWLNDNEAILRRTLNKTPARQTPTDSLPEWIWYQGVQTALSVHAANHIQIRPSEILLPEKENAAQLTHLRRFLHERAHEYLLPRLEGHIRTTRLTPSAIPFLTPKPSGAFAATPPASVSTGDSSERPNMSPTTSVCTNSPTCAIPTTALHFGL